MDRDVRYAVEVVAKDPMATHLGIQVEEVRRAYARLEGRGIEAPVRKKTRARKERFQRRKRDP